VRQLISVSILNVDHEPLEEGLQFQLVKDDGTVLCTAATDQAGVVTFPVDPATVGTVAIRLDPESISVN
jgi:hypothetical protein